MAARSKTRRHDPEATTTIPVTHRTRQKLTVLVENMKPQPSRISLVEHLVDEALKAIGIDPATASR